MEDASLTSENVSESEAVGSVEGMSGKVVDDQLIGELVSRT
jgi:hypothetical protein